MATTQEHGTVLWSALSAKSTQSLQLNRRPWGKFATCQREAGPQARSRHWQGRNLPHGLLTDLQQHGKRDLVALDLCCGVKEPVLILHPGFRAEKDGPLQLSFGNEHAG